MDDTLLWVLLITSIAGIGGTGMGGIIGALIKKESNKLVSTMLCFAAGVMLSVVCFDLLAEAIFPENANANMLPMCIFFTFIGYCIVALLNYIIDRHTRIDVPHYDEDHPKTADDLGELIHSDHFFEHKRNNSNLYLAGVIMAFAIALHNVPEGMVIGASYATATGENIWSGSGFVMAIIICMHNIPEGMAISVPLIAGGMPRLKAMALTALSGAPTVLGALVGYSLGKLGAFWSTVSLSFASGAMLYVVFAELLPEAYLMLRSKLPSLAVLVGLICGMVIVFA